MDGKPLSKKDIIARTVLEEEIEIFQMLELEADEFASQRRECPVPKPRTVLGRLFDTRTERKDENDAELKTPEEREKR